MTSSSESLLHEFSQLPTPPTVTEVVPGVIYHVMGYGHSNATFVITSDSVVLVDTLDSAARGATLLSLIRERTTKPISTIIYTHGHPDHRGGAGSQIEDQPEIIAFAPASAPLARQERVHQVLAKRGARQFGYSLDDSDLITQGLGPREGHTHGDGYAMVAPNRVVTGPDLDLRIGGVNIRLVAAAGETDDTIYVWFPDFGVVCSADNYYACWPNLYAIRGGQYRNVATWIDSLDRLMALNASALLPGHFQPIIGMDNVRRRITDYRDALDFVLNETLRLIDEGTGINDLGSKIQLPDHLKELPFLREHYGTIEWSAKAIFTGYVGWFDGNPTNLHPLATDVRAEKLIRAMGGAEKVRTEILQANATGEFQWAMELCDLALAIDSDDAQAREAKVQAMLGAAENEISACGRNYYTSCAKELTSS